MIAVCRALAKENARLHAKQAMQLEVLEDSLHHMGVLLCKVQNDIDAAFLSAAILDLHAGALMQQLSTHSSIAAGSSHNRASAAAGVGPRPQRNNSGKAAASTATVSASAADNSHPSWSELCRLHGGMHSSSGSASIGGTAGTGGDSSSGNPVTGARWRSRTQRMWASITPQAVLDIQGIPVTGLAGKGVRPMPCSIKSHTPLYTPLLRNQVCDDCWTMFGTPSSTGG
jgi:hypothetical protein